MLPNQSVSQWCMPRIATKACGDYNVHGCCCSRCAADGRGLSLQTPPRHHIRSSSSEACRLRRRLSTKAPPPTWMRGYLNDLRASVVTQPVAEREGKRSRIRQRHPGSAGTGHNYPSSERALNVGRLGRRRQTCQSASGLIVDRCLDVTPWTWWTGVQWRDSRRPRLQRLPLPRRHRAISTELPARSNFRAWSSLPRQVGYLST